METRGSHPPTLSLPPACRREGPGPAPGGPLLSCEKGTGFVLFCAPLGSFLGLVPVSALSAGGEFHPPGGGLRAWRGPWIQEPRPADLPPGAGDVTRLPPAHGPGTPPVGVWYGPRPLGAALSTNITCPLLPGAPPSALAADGTVGPDSRAPDAGSILCMGSTTPHRYAVCWGPLRASQGATVERPHVMYLPPWGGAPQEEGALTKKQPSRLVATAGRTGTYVL